MPFITKAHWFQAESGIQWLANVYPLNFSTFYHVATTNVFLLGFYVIRPTQSAAKLWSGRNNRWFPNLGLLSYWKLKLRPSLKSLADFNRFSSKISTMALFLPLFHKSWFVECMANSCPVARFSHLSCGSLQLLHSYHGPLSCFSDQCSPCRACQFRLLRHTLSIFRWKIEQWSMRCSMLRIFLHILMML